MHIHTRISISIQGNIGYLGHSLQYILSLLSHCNLQHVLDISPTLIYQCSVNREITVYVAGVATPKFQPVVAYSQLS